MENYFKRTLKVLQAYRNSLIERISFWTLASLLLTSSWSHRLTAAGAAPITVIRKLDKAQLVRNDRNFKDTVERIVTDAGRSYSKRKFFIFSQRGALGLSEAGISILEEICHANDRKRAVRKGLFGWLAEESFQGFQLSHSDKEKKARALRDYYGRFWRMKKQRMQNAKVLLQEGALSSSPAAIASNSVPVRAVHHCNRKEYNAEVALFEKVVTNIFTDAGKTYDREVVFCKKTEEKYGVSTLSETGLRAIQEIYDSEKLRENVVCSLWLWLCDQMYSDLTDEKRRFHRKRIERRFNFRSVVSRSKRSPGAGAGVGAGAGAGVGAGVGAGADGTFECDMSSALRRKRQRTIMMGPATVIPSVDASENPFGLDGITFTVADFLGLSLGPTEMTLAHALGAMRCKYLNTSEVEKSPGGGVIAAPYGAEK